MIVTFIDLLKEASLKPNDLILFQNLIRDSETVKVWSSPGHIYLCYGNNMLNNLLSFDTVSGSDAWFSHQFKTKKSPLKLKMLPSPVVDVIFPSCCSETVIWVVLKNGIVYIWSFTRLNDEGPHWTPTGQFFITNTSENIKFTIDHVLYHRKSNVLYWSEQISDSDSKTKYVIKKMALPSDIVNVKGNSIVPHISVILNNCPKSKLYACGNFVIIQFLPPCPPSIFCTWFNPKCLHFIHHKLDKGICEVVWKSDLLYKSIDFKELSLSLSRFWSAVDGRKPSNTIFTCLDLDDSESLIISQSGSVVKFNCSGKVEKMFEISDFNPVEVKFIFTYMSVLCCFTNMQMNIYSLEDGEFIEKFDLNIEIKDMWIHDCCSKLVGLLLNDGRVLKVCAANPNDLFKLQNKYAVQLLRSSNQYFLEFLSRLYQFAVNGDSDLRNIHIINQKLLQTKASNNKSIICVIKQMMKVRNLYILSETDPLSRLKMNNISFDHNQKQLTEYYKELDNMIKDIIDNCNK